MGAKTQKWSTSLCRTQTKTLSTNAQMKFKASYCLIRQCLVNTLLFFRTWTTHQRKQRRSLSTPTRKKMKLFRTMKMAIKSKSIFKNLSHKLTSKRKSNLLAMKKLEMCAICCAKFKPTWSKFKPKPKCRCSDKTPTMRISHRTATGTSTLCWSNCLYSWQYWLSSCTILRQVWTTSSCCEFCSNLNIEINNVYR